MLDFINMKQTCFNNLWDIWIDTSLCRESKQIPKPNWLVTTDLQKHKLSGNNDSVGYLATTVDVVQRGAEAARHSGGVL